MLVEIAVPDLLLTVVVVFLAAFLGFFIYDRISSASGKGGGDTAVQVRRMQYYEGLLVEMKIRLDAMEIGRSGDVGGPRQASMQAPQGRAAGRAGAGMRQADASAAKSPGPSDIAKTSTPDVVNAPGVQDSVASTRSGSKGTGGAATRRTGTVETVRVPNMPVENITAQVLHLITDTSRTSRDIQITLGKSREHVSRLLKRMFEDGLVSRNEAAKPFTYSITAKGRKTIVGGSTVVAVKAA